ncbi:excisionase family DNA-binding protein [Stenotrophomonas maltophilia]|uniref:excisionase family DNA-binding protein n=1 Tax=Stenotrophomonas maltophilia TaxID=40324 RepID=UPI003D2F7FBD
MKGCRSRCGCAEDGVGPPGNQKINSTNCFQLAQAAELCACHLRTLRRAINDGQLTAMRSGQGARSDRIHAADLEAWGSCSGTCPHP